MKCLVSASDGERYSVCPNDEFYVCGFRAFAKNIWRFLANGMGASGVNHRHDDKVNTAETPLIFLSTVHTLYCFCYSLISHTYLWEISLHPPPVSLSLPLSLSHTHRVVERGRVKCGQYWPLEAGRTEEYGYFLVRNIQIEIFQDFKLSHLELYNSQVRTYFLFCIRPPPGDGGIMCSACLSVCLCIFSQLCVAVNSCVIINYVDNSLICRFSPLIQRYTTVTA